MSRRIEEQKIRVKTGAGSSRLKSLVEGVLVRGVEETGARGA